MIYYNCRGCHKWRAVRWEGENQDEDTSHEPGADGWCRECKARLAADGNVLEDT